MKNLECAEIKGMLRRVGAWSYITFRRSGAVAALFKGIVRSCKKFKRELGFSEQTGFKHLKNESGSMIVFSYQK